jgi:hypothetical protein|tara:strand:+ start:1232 stop:1600 length:369 start_codon:yes stop_codon:yes gene_type:complete
MKLFEKLTDENFTMFAMQCYDNPQCTSVDEFMEDLRRFRYLKRLLRRYYKNDELRERLLLNHLICLLNIFGVPNCIKMLDFKIEEEYWPVLKTMLIYMGHVEEDWRPSIPIDMTVAEILREL